jgi:hypothetical protein
VVSALLTSRCRRHNRHHNHPTTTTTIIIITVMPFGFVTIPFLMNMKTGISVRPE